MPRACIVAASCWTTGSRNGGSLQLRQPAAATACGNRRPAGVAHGSGLRRSVARPVRSPRTPPQKGACPRPARRIGVAPGESAARRRPGRGPFPLPCKTPCRLSVETTVHSASCMSAPVRGEALAQTAFPFAVVGQEWRGLLAVQTCSSAGCSRRWKMWPRPSCGFRYPASAPSRHRDDPAPLAAVYAGGGRRVALGVANGALAARRRHLSPLVSIGAPIRAGHTRRCSCCGPFRARRLRDAFCWSASSSIFPIVVNSWTGVKAIRRSGWLHGSHERQ